MYKAIAKFEFGGETYELGDIIEFDNVQKLLKDDKIVEVLEEELDDNCEGLLLDNTSTIKIL